MSSDLRKPGRTKIPGRARKAGCPTEASIAPAAAAQCGGGYDPILKRRVVFELPDAAPLSDHEIELFGRLFGDVIDEILDREGREP
jgi:hypothetical protein